MTKTKRILVVEDERIVAADIVEILQRLGYQVIGPVTSGAKAIEFVNKEHPDLVLMDIRIQGEIDGIETAERIRKIANLPVVYLTAHADENTITRAFSSDPYGYVLKPFQEAELRIAIGLALQKHEFEMKGRESSPISKGSQCADEGRKEIVDILRSVSPIAKLSGDQIRNLAEHCHVEVISSGQVLAFEGEEEIPGFLVISGRLALVKTSPNGRELTVELISPNSALGLIPRHDGGENAFSLKAQMDSKVLWVPRSCLVWILDLNPELYRELLDSVCDSLARSHNQCRALAHDRVEVRIASALLSLLPQGSAQAGKEMNASATVVITRQELANLTGATVETAIRVTKNFERSGVLDLAIPGKIKVLDSGKLAQVAGES